MSQQQVLAYETHIRALPDVERHDLYCEVVAAYREIAWNYRRSLDDKYGEARSIVRDDGRGCMLSRSANAEMANRLDRREQAKLAFNQAEYGLSPHQLIVVRGLFIRNESAAQIGPHLHGKKHDPHANRHWVQSKLQDALPQMAFNLGFLSKGPKKAAVRAWRVTAPHKPISSQPEIAQPAPAVQEAAPAVEKEGVSS
jgi:hypothetical protein